MKASQKEVLSRIIERATAAGFYILCLPDDTSTKAKGVAVIQPCALSEEKALEYLATLPPQNETLSAS